MNGGGFRYPPPIPSKPAKRFKLEDFTFVKVLGKGSFGKVNLKSCDCLMIRMIKLYDTVNTQYEVYIHLHVHVVT